MSPWFACGALSVRYVYHEVKKFEKKYSANESTKVYIDEMFWRDFNEFWAMKFKNKIFTSYGIYDRTYYNWTPNDESLRRWKEG
jgi:deoxyribodipyrimidine photo-lyase